MKKFTSLFCIVFVLNISATITDIPENQPKLQESIINEENLITTTDIEIRDSRFFWNFEDDNGGLNSNNQNGWQWGIPSSGPFNAYSGDKLWGTVLANDYPNGANFTLDSPEYYLITSFDPILFFWHWYDIETSWDGGNVKVSSDGGLSWSVLEPANGYTGVANALNPLNGEPIFTGHDHCLWEYEEFDLSSYIGQNLIFRWHFGSDNSISYPGWYIDDVGTSGYSSGYLSGTVTEFGSGNPIEGATVSIIGTELNDITQADGTYFIIGTLPGVFDISCVAPFYLDAEELNFNIVNVTTTLDFSLLWSEISVYPDEITVTLPPDSMNTTFITITNNGPGDLIYSMSVEYTDVLTRPENWLLYSNNPVTVPGNGGTVEDGVIFNTAGLNASDVHTANLLIHNNSNYGGDYVIPVVLNVGYVNLAYLELPFVTKLSNNYPNPFNPVTNIVYSIKEAGNVSIEIYNLSGQLVKTLINETKETGTHITRWDGTDNSNKPVSSGVYFYKMDSGKFNSTKKMILLK